MKFLKLKQVDDVATYINFENVAEFFPIPTGTRIVYPFEALGDYAFTDVEESPEEIATRLKNLDAPTVILNTSII